MALLKRIATQKLEASTLVEVLVSMAIVIIAFGLGLSIYFTVLNSDRNRMELEASLLINEIIAESTAQQLWLNETIKLDYLTIEKTLTPYEGMRDRLQTLTVTAYNKQGRVIAQCKELVITE